MDSENFSERRRSLTELYKFRFSVRRPNTYRTAGSVWRLCQTEFLKTAKKDQPTDQSFSKKYKTFPKLLNYRFKEIIKIF